MSTELMKEYDGIYNQIMSEKGRAEIGDDIVRQERVVEKIQKFLDEYPKIIPPDRNPDTPWIQLSLYEIVRRCLKTAIDIIQDISGVVSIRPYYSSSTIRRKIVQIFTREDRRIYVGIWLIFLSFILYFIDSAA